MRVLTRQFDHLIALGRKTARKFRVTMTGVMIKGPNGIGKSHSIVSLVRKLLYDSDGGYLVTFIPNCDTWSGLGNLYDAICASFGCTK